MAQTTIYDLLTATLKAMPLPASTNDVYMRLLKQQAYAHMAPNVARKRISTKLCYMRDTKKTLVSKTLDDGRMVWDFNSSDAAVTVKSTTKAVFIVPQSTTKAADIVATTTTKKPPDHTYVLHVLFSDIAAAFAKAAHGLISNDK